MLESNGGDLLNIYMFRKADPRLACPFIGIVALGVSRSLFLLQGSLLRTRIRRPATG